ncbi:MAG: hypothetical protein QNJ70_15585 [Xenococcaceae cyanobacterium MO_207.B15]|nr:hypothetical protein [Xenococcaceae cyanobacterium MO_207.B15]
MKIFDYDTPDDAIARINQSQSGDKLCWHIRDRIYLKTKVF